MSDKITVHIKQNETGEIREHKMQTHIKDFCSYIWEEGNFACDCNRNTFFYEEGDEPEGSDHCSDGRYTILRIVDDKTGRVLYMEKEIEVDNE